MLARTHAFVAIIALATVQAGMTVTGYEFIQPHLVGGLDVGPPLCGAAAVLGGLLPDLDARNSKIRRRLGRLGGLLSGIKRRGVLHSGLAMITATILALLVGREFGYEDVGLALGVGYCSHVIIADALTISGVPLFWPAKRRFHWLPRPFRIRTGGRVESVVTAVAAWLLLLGAMNITPDDFLNFIRQQFLNLG